MKEQNSPKKSSRRSFTKSIACSLAAAPLVSDHGPSPQPGVDATETARHSNNGSTILSPVFFKDHIPPVEIWSDSLTLHSSGGLSDPMTIREQPMKQVFTGNKKIKGVRVIMTDGAIKVDYRDDPVVRGGQIKIWVINPIGSNHDMMLSTPVAGELQVVFTNSRHKFIGDGPPTSHRRKKYKCDCAGQNVGIMKVAVLNSDGFSLAELTTDPDHEQEIDRILIWTEI